MRAVPLGPALWPRIWQVQKGPPRKGKGAGIFAFSADDFYHLSCDAEHADYFLYHSWQDTSLPKMRLLRFFLCVVLGGGGGEGLDHPLSLEGCWGSS